MPRKPSSIPKRPRASKTQQGFSDTPRIMSDEEKHELIRMHVAARAPQDPLQRISLWAGVTLSLFAIGFGWWMTTGQVIRRTATDGSADLREAAAELDRFTQMVETNDVLNRLAPSPVSEAEAGSFNDVLRSNLSATRTQDLFVPAEQATSSDSQSDVPAGLTPDS